MRSSLALRSGLALARRPLTLPGSALARRHASSDAVATATAGGELSQAKAVEQDKESISAFTGAPASQLNSRVVKIYQEAQTVQNATQNMIGWRLQWEDAQTKRWSNPLMGWTSTSDPLSNTHMTMSFSRAEDAMRFCEQNGAPCTPPPPPVRPRRASPARVVYARAPTPLCTPSPPLSSPLARSRARRLELRGGAGEAKQGDPLLTKEVLRQLQVEGSEGAQNSRSVCAAAAAAAAAQKLSAARAAAGQLGSAACRDAASARLRAALG